jgi:hypothetical protein
MIRHDPMPEEVPTASAGVRDRERDAEIVATSAPPRRLLSSAPNRSESPRVQPALVLPRVAEVTVRRGEVR